jgi:glycosyltransferase involved in cell wall biosynthesis
MIGAGVTGSRGNGGGGRRDPGREVVGTAWSPREALAAKHPERLAPRGRKIAPLRLMRLSVLVPVYNERRTIARMLVAVASALPGVDKEVIIVDDGSRDGTREWLRETFPSDNRVAVSVRLGPSDSLVFADGPGDGRTAFRPVYHTVNAGKGAAVRTAFKAATGDVLVIQDADLEYDPEDWERMYDLIAKRRVADVVYGSRFYGRPHRSLYFHHYLANRLISLLFNMLYNQTLSDIEVGYKMMTAEVARSLRLTASDFGIEVEISAEIARRRGTRIYEMGISYYGRSYDEGKKIGWRDGLKALWYLFKYRFRRRGR